MKFTPSNFNVFDRNEIKKNEKLNKSLAKLLTCFELLIAFDELHLHKLLCLKPLSWVLLEHSANKLLKVLRCVTVLRVFYLVCYLKISEVLLFSTSLIDSEC